MNTSQFKRMLIQTLENYQRCGLTRFGKRNADELPATWLERVGTLTTDSSVRRVEPNEVAAESERDTLAVSLPAWQTSNREAGPNASRGKSQQSSGDAGQWELPVLAEAERTLQFERLSAEVKACRKCAKIVDFRQQTVFGVGPLSPTVCFVGEAPGADEDRQGEPFVGKAGQLLNRIIVAMHLKREEVYILNALKCRPPQNRTPLTEEIESCRHFVDTQLEVLQPQYIVCLGAVAVRSILQLTDSIGRLRGRWHMYRGAKVVVTYHPSYLLRNESAKRLVWDDMKMLMRELGLKSEP